LKNGYSNKRNIHNENILLVKYWKYKGFDENEIEKKLKEFMVDFQDLFNDNIIEYKIKKSLMIGMKYELVFNKSISITKNDIEIINRFEDISIRKLLFILLVLWKFNDYKRYRVSNNELKKLASVKCNGDNFWKYINILTKSGYLKMVEYHNKQFYILEWDMVDSDVLVSISNYDDLILYYFLCINPEKHSYCEQCGKIIELTVNNRVYCKECAYEKEKIRKREWKRKSGSEANDVV
jgi:ribosomal protein L37E